MRKKSRAQNKIRMQNERRMIIALLIIAVIAVIVGVILFANSKKKTNKTEDTKVTMETENEDEKIEENSDETSEETTEDQTTSTSDETTEVSVWTTTNLKLRKEPNTNGEVITTIPKGTELKKTSEENGWAFVKFGDSIGYVSAQYVTDIDPTPSNTTKVEVIPGQFRDANNIIICIDPGHQLKGESATEPNGPGSSTMKARVTSGTTGVSTGIAEYIMNLEVSLKLRTELENRGYTVCMTRTTHDVRISNKERAEYANSKKADITVRIHGNGSTDRSVHGAEAYAPSANNAYVSHLSKASISLSQCILDQYCEATGFKNRGVFATDTMTGINWCEMPVTIIELGYMSNAEEDAKLNDATMQNNMVQGIANGIDKYFGF